MRKTESLSDLLVEELANLLDAEDQLIEALPKMAEASQSSALKNTLGSYLEITREHIDRLQGIFSNTGQTPQKSNCKTMKELIAESEDVIKKTEKSQTRDAAIIWVAQRMEQYEIAEYKKVREHAADLGHTKIVELFTKTLNDERAMNFHLNELAQGIINIQTIDPKDFDRQQGGFYIPKEKFRRGGIKKKNKNTDVSRFISEGNPNLENPEEQGDLS